jgi:hypothetical protein
MEYQLENIKTMSAVEVATLLSQALRDLSQRKITLKQATTLSRVALALVRVIESADLNDRIEFLEQVLKKKKSR